MAKSIRNFIAGLLCGALVSHVAVRAIAVTAAIAMPPGFDMPLWSVLVVYGLGAFLPALAIHSVCLAALRPSLLASLSGFCIGTIAGLSVLAGLAFAGAALSAIILGALASTALASRWSSDAGTPRPHRDTA